VCHAREYTKPTGSWMTLSLDGSSESAIGFRFRVRLM